MKHATTIALLLTWGLLLGGRAPAQKLTLEERTELVRGLLAEFATAKTILPRSKKPLEVSLQGQYDKTAWKDALDGNGPAARVGDQVQITKVDLEKDRIVLEINYGMKGRQRWWHNIQMGGGMGGGGGMQPINGQPATEAPSGTSLALVFGGPLPAKHAAEVKKLLQPVLDFEKHSATELFVDTLPKEMQEAIREKKAVVGMDRDMVLLAKGRPDNKQRESKDGQEREDWIYGKPPGTITFVTFEADKVVQVKELYAGLQ
jgi:hypothetical protein